MVGAAPESASSRTPLLRLSVPANNSRLSSCSSAGRTRRCSRRFRAWVGLFLPTRRNILFNMEHLIGVRDPLPHVDTMEPANPVRKGNAERRENTTDGNGSCRGASRHYVWGQYCA